MSDLLKLLAKDIKSRSHKKETNNLIDSYIQQQKDDRAKRHANPGAGLNLQSRAVGMGAQTNRAQTNAGLLAGNFRGGFQDDGKLRSSSLVTGSLKKIF